MYKFFDNKKQKFRFVVLKTLVEGTEWYLWKREHWVEEVIQDIDRNYVLWFDTRINRWIVYRFVETVISLRTESPEFNASLRQFIGKYVHMTVIDDGKGGYREPGYWLYYLLRTTSFDKGNLQEEIHKSVNRLEEQTKEQKEKDFRAKEAQEEIDKLFSDFYLGKSTFCLGQRGPSSKGLPKRNKKKVIFRSALDGKILGTGQIINGKVVMNVRS
jgi:hypothetical protein